MRNTTTDKRKELNYLPSEAENDDSTFSDETVGIIQRFNSCNPSYVFLTTKEVASLLRVSHKKLEADRLHGTGPPYKKLGGKVIYCLKELLIYLDNNTRLNTCK